MDQLPPQRELAFIKVFSGFTPLTEIYIFPVVGPTSSIVGPGGVFMEIASEEDEHLRKVAAWIDVCHLGTGMGNEVNTK